MGREAKGHGVLRRIRRSLGPPSPRVRAAFQRVVAGTRVRHGARVAVSGAVDAPCVVDATTVVLPPRCQEELPDAELLAVLAHEVAHIGRRDVRRQALLRLATAVLWFQPLNRLVLRRLRDLAELICDDWAVGRIPSPLDLARSISRVAEWSAPVYGREQAFAGSQGGRLSERVRRIVTSRGDGGAGAGGRLRGALVAALLLAALAQLPPIPVPGGTRGVFVLQDAVRVDSGVQQLRMTVRRTGT
jgi:hypothetical protein